MTGGLSGQRDGRMDMPCIVSSLSPPHVRPLTTSMTRGRTTQNRVSLLYSMHTVIIMLTPRNLVSPEIDTNMTPFQRNGNMTGTRQHIALSRSWTFEKFEPLRTATHHTDHPGQHLCLRMRMRIVCNTLACLACFEGVSIAVASNLPC